MTPRERLARTAAELEPLKQGALDGLCGLYSIINAVALVVHPHQPLTEKQQVRLFGSGIRWLQRHVSLSDAVANGLTTSRWRELAAFLVAKHRRETRLRLALTLPLSACRQPASDVIRSIVTSEIERGSPVLLSLDGTYDHFSVAVSYTSERLNLFDSNGATWVQWRTLGSRSTRHIITRRGVASLNLLR